MTPHKSKREKEKSKRGNSHCHVDLLEAKIMFESTNIFLVLGYLVATKKKNTAITGSTLETYQGVKKFSNNVN